MKTKLIFFIAMLISLSTMGQAAVGVQVTQDARLAFTKDTHGNSPFTTDIQVKVVMQGYDFGFGYLAIAPKYEFANLAGGDYSRFGFEVGYSFHTGVAKIDVTPIIGYGYAFRWGGRYTNFEYSLEMKLPLIKNVSAIGLVNLNQRKEIDKFGYNVGFGFRYDISTDYLRKQSNKGTRF